jgi:hypothetical protein
MPLLAGGRTNIDPVDLDPGMRTVVRRFAWESDDYVGGLTLLAKKAVKNECGREAAWSVTRDRERARYGPPELPWPDRGSAGSARRR